MGFVQSFVRLFAVNIPSSAGSHEWPWRTRKPVFSIHAASVWIAHRLTVWG
jgi:hypothetical protein